MSDRKEKFPTDNSQYANYTPGQWWWWNAHIPITLLEQVALLLTAVLFVSLELMHAVTSLPALGILENKVEIQQKWSLFCHSVFADKPECKRTEQRGACEVMSSFWRKKAGQALSCPSHKT